MRTLINNVRLVGIDSAATAVEFDDTVITIRPADTASDTGPGTEIIDGGGHFLAPGDIGSADARCP